MTSSLNNEFQTLIKLSKYNITFILYHKNETVIQQPHFRKLFQKGFFYLLNPVPLLKALVPIVTPFDCNAFSNSVTLV